MNNNVLITGGSGMVGSFLSGMLTDKGYTVSHLSRSKRPDSKYKTWQWDISRGYIEEGAIEAADYIVHLAGAGVADKRWTEKRKKEIYDSRVDSTNLLVEAISKAKKKPVSFISASAVGYYGDQGDKWLDESMPPGEDFLADVCEKWEQASEPLANLGVRVARLRIGIVLSTRGGALEKMLLPAKFGAGAYFGSGEQYYPWIHIEDLCRMFTKAIEDDKVMGNYNAVGPSPVPNKVLANAVRDALNRPGIVLPAPEFALKLAMGEMAYVVLMSTRASSQKIQGAGFEFKFPELLAAISDLVARGV